MLAMFVSREHDNWDDLLPFMMLAYNTTVHTTTGFTPYRLVFGDECNLPGNLVHRELRPDPPPGIRVLTLLGYSKPYMNHMMRCARNNKGPRTVRNTTTIVKRLRAHSQVDAGHFVTIHQQERINFVHHGLDPTR